MHLSVSKPILADYVEDRLRQLEGKENLTEKEAEELDFIRKNRHDPKSLADFYGMEIKEGQEQRAVEIQEKREPVVESSVGEANYTVNLASFREKIRPDRHAEELEKQGLEAFRWEVDLPRKGKWHRGMEVRTCSSRPVLEPSPRTRHRRKRACVMKVG